jgi:exopolyphosphatase / guanosine-5'-triphosphate,3'-diphosphate pyrophosphatase
MDDEARSPGSLDPVRARGPRRRSPWGRRYGRDVQEEGHEGASSHPPTYAALDLGTNNCRLLVARPTADGFRVVDAFSRIIRLGEGVSGSGRISAAAIARALDALTVCRDKMHNRHVTRARLIATEACRAAENGMDFIAGVRDRVGLDLEIIDRETEAEFAATGCAPLVDPHADGVILFDIGGGSSELVSMGSAGARAGPALPVIHAWASLPVGVVTRAERHGGINVDRALFEVMVGEVAAYVERFIREQAVPPASDRIHLLGTSGTVTTIAGVHLELRRYDRRYVDGCWMSNEQISAVVERLLAMTYEERVANPCIGAERADLVLAGCAILEAIRRAFPCKRLRVADRGLREGMLVQMMRDDGVWKAPATVS